MVVANASNARTVSDALAERLDGFGAVLDDRSLATGLVAIQGPRSLEILQPLAGVDLASIRYYGIAEGVVAGIPAQVARTGYTGEDGFELFVDVERAGEAWDAVLEAGRPLGLVPVGLGARDTLRLEAGMPLYGNELDRATTRRTRRAWTASSSWPRPATSRVAPPSRRSPPTASGAALSGSSCGVAGSPATGTRSSMPTASRASSPRGTMSPTLGVAIAMAYVAPAHAQPGTMLDVEIRGARVAAEVVPLPFYKRPA